MDNENSHITALSMTVTMKVQSCAGWSKAIVDLLLQMNWRAFVFARLMTPQIMLEYADTLTL